MNTIKKYEYCLLFSVLSAVLLILSLSHAPKDTLCFLVHTDTGDETISVYHNDQSEYFVFLPAFADLAQVSIQVPADQVITLDGNTLTNDMTCHSFSLDTPYVYYLDGQQMGTLQFLQSANVPTMFIDTVSGNLEHIHNDKEHKEAAFVSLYTPHGSNDFVDTQCTINGRGNSTWLMDKRPYKLTFSAEEDLLGMGHATNWVLLANAMDETNLNNKLAYTLAARLNLGWVPECHWIDLYMNGEYRGLYLLTEKVEVHENRLPLDLSSGDFLCKLDIGNRWEDLNYPYYTEAGQVVDIAAPQNVTEQDFAHIEYWVEQLERSILAKEDLSAIEFIDLDSWARRFLLDETLGNVDGGDASSYFYFSDGIFHAGPAWDYDISLGSNLRNRDPNAFITIQNQPYSSSQSSYYYKLYTNDIFFYRMKELYQTECLPLLEQLADKEIDTFAATIQAASRMNSIRWQNMFAYFEDYPTIVNSPLELKEYLHKRILFLNRAWLDEVEFCSVLFKTDAGTARFSAEAGSCLNIPYEDILSTVWVDSETGEVFDFSQPITEGLILVKQTPDIPVPKNVLTENDRLMLIAVCAVFAVMLVGMIAADLTPWCRKRRDLHGHK